MAINCAQFEFVSNTTTGVQTIATGLGFTPKCYILVGVMATSNGSFEAGHALVIGMSDGTTSICGGVLSVDNAATSTTGRAYSNTVLRLPSTTTPSSAVDAIASHSSFGSGTIAINWTDAPSSAWRFYGMAWGGADLQCKVTAHTFGTVATGVQAYNSVTNFTPEVGFFMCPEEALSLPYSAAHACIGFGAAVSTTKRFLMSLNAETAATTSDNWSLLSDSKCVGCLRDATGAYSARAFGDFSAWSSTGFSINWEIAPHDTTNHFYSLLMAGGDWDIIQVSKRTTTGTTTLSPSVNTIKGLLGFTTNTTLSDAANSTICRASIGLCSSTSAQGGVWSGDLDGQGTAQVTAKRNEDSNFLITATENATHGSSTVTGLASITAMSNTATLNYTTATAVTADIFIVACGEVTITSISDTLTVRYNVTNTASDTSTLKYNIEQKIIDTLTTRYNLEAKVVDTSTLRFNVTQLASDTCTLRYDILQRVTDTSTLLYHLEQKIVDTLTTRYNLEQKITDTSTLRFNITTPLSDTLTLRYNLTTLVTDTSTLRFNLNQLASDNLTLRFNLEAKVVDTSTLIYNIVNTISDTLTLRYNLSTALSDTLTLRYNLTTLVSDTSTLRFNLTQLATDNVTLRYDIIARVSDTLTTLYNIVNTVLDTSTLRFNITTLVSDTLTLRYDLLQQAIDTITLRYDLIASMS